MKKLLAILLALATLFAVVACTAQTPKGEETSATEVSTDAPKATTGEDPTTEPTTEPTTQPEEPTTDPQPLDKEKEYRILFIGNSYSHYNTMPTEIFAPIAKAAGYKVTVDTVLKGSYTMQGFADPNDTYGKQVHAKLKSNVKYDFVVIQEQSSRPISDPALFYDGARALDALIKANGAKTVFYSTWGRKTGDRKSVV